MRKIEEKGPEQTVLSPSASLEIATMAPVALPAVAATLAVASGAAPEVPNITNAAARTKKLPPTLAVAYTANKLDASYRAGGKQRELDAMLKRHMIVPPKP